MASSGLGRVERYVLRALLGWPSAPCSHRRGARGVIPAAFCCPLRGAVLLALLTPAFERGSKLLRYRGLATGTASAEPAMKK